MNAYHGLLVFFMRLPGVAYGNLSRLDCPILLIEVAKWPRRRISDKENDCKRSVYLSFSSVLQAYSHF